MKKTLKSTLLTWFLVFSVIVILLFLGGNSIYIQQKTKISDLVTSIYDLHLDVQKDFNVVDAFLSYEVSNIAYYETRQSEILDDHHARIAVIKTHLSDFSGSAILKRMGLSPAFDSLKADLNNYALLFDQIVELNLERGFKDYGIVGKMRNFVHELETFDALDQTYVLGLRRHEKDYIIRNEEQYVEKLNNLGYEFQQIIENDSRIGNEQKEFILRMLNSYLLEFNKLVDLDKRIGVKSPELGKKLELDQSRINLERQFNMLIERAEERKIVVFRYFEIFYLAFFIAFLLISILLSQTISKRISYPLTTLTNHIKKLSGNNLVLEDNLDDKFQNYETAILYQEFRLLIEQIKKEQDDLNRVQSALVENEEKYRQLADHLPQSVFETDQFGNLTYVNSNWLKTLGYTSEDISEGLNIINVLKAESGPISIGDESKGAAEYTSVRKDGTTFPGLVYTNRINRDNKLIGFRGTIIDITERKNRMDRLVEEKEKAEQADKLKSTFLSNMSHEIRTPMNAIIGFSNLLKNQNLSRKDVDMYLSHIQGSGDHLLKLIDDIIDIARIEAGEVVIHYTNFVVREIMDELYTTMNDYKKNHDKAHLELKCRIPDGYEEYIVSSDPFRLRQVLINLLSNAIKFTQAGYIEYGFTVESKKKLKFFVKDTGIGMGRTEQVDAFDRFVQLNKKDRVKQVGTGLGLAISKSLVELLGGRITVQSEIGRGSEFIFTILADAVKEQTSIKEQVIRLDETRFDFKNVTILIAEDENNNFLYLNAVLSKTGANILRAEDGKKAVEFIKSNGEINLLLLDIQMPELDGFDVIRIVRDLRPELPVIAQTAYAMQKERENIKEAGFDDYISKPINDNELLNKIAFYLKKATADSQ